MSTLLINPAARKAPADVWARLIPGEQPPFRRDAKKPPTSVKLGLHKVETTSLPATRDHGAFELLLPRPLQSKMGKQWAESVGIECALIALNWLAVGALLIPGRVLLRHWRILQFAEGAPLHFLGIALLHAALITLIGHTEGLYSKNNNLLQQRKILAKSVTLATLVLCLTCWMQGASWAVSILICCAALLHFGTLGILRKAQQSRFMNCEVREMRNVLIIGAGAVGRRVASYLADHPSSGRSVYGFLDDDQPLGNGVVGRIADMPQLARRGFVEELILAAPRDRDITQWLFREARTLRLDLEIVPELFGCDSADSEIEHVGCLPVICVHAERLPALGLILKRVIDFVGSASALVSLSPLLAAIAVLIKIDSRGSLLYSADRAGRKGRLFRCYKFRTMVSNADDLKISLRRNNERSGPFFKITADPRITRVGRFLRRYSLDELPQLFNVLKGEMSLVGPRPHPLDDVAAYELEHLARLDVIPGITGLWQVTARHDPSFERNMELDREYIRRWSLSLDARILLKTVAAVLLGSGE